MKINRKLKAGTFISRQTRFSALVDVDGKQELAYLPNSGRMRELLLPGAEVLLADMSRDGRRTSLDLLLVRNEDLLVSIDSRVPNQLVNEALLSDGLVGFEGCTVISREASYGESRLDFLLATSAGHYCLLETKSVTLVKNGLAIFPDAPTLRGARHLNELAMAIEEGFAGAVVFVVQRIDARSFMPNGMMDPLFDQAIRKAAEAGVTLKAFTCQISEDQITIAEEIPVLL